MTAPQTRASLLIRLRNHGDTAAWDEFVRLYHPVITRVALRRGMQPADAEDLAQTVLLSVANAIERFDPGREDARFRTWLGRIANNAVINAITRGVPDQGSGDQDVHAWLESLPSDSGEESRLLRMECRRQMFLQAAAELRGSFNQTTWEAFWRTAVDGQSVEATARLLGIAEGSVYAARSRVMRRLRQAVARFEEFGGGPS